MAEAHDESELLATAQEIQALCGALTKAARRGLERRLEAEGVGTLPFGVLRVLAREPLTLAEVARRMQLAPASLVAAVDALEQRGLLRRGSDARDRRRSPLTITPEGVALLARVPPLDRADGLAQALTELGPEAAVALRDGLRSLLALLPGGAAAVEGIAARARGDYPRDSSEEE